MQHNVRIIAALLIMVSVSMSGGALGHGPAHHSQMIPADEQMKKLHAMMPMFSTSIAELENALDRNEAGKVESEAGKILAAIPDLKKTKPHKNIKQHKRYVQLAAELEKSLLITVKLSNNGNTVGAKTAFKKVETVCSSCHATFRD